MVNNIINPFITTGYAGAAYFCDREQETADLTRLLVNGNNVALISPRRYGKTNLIRHCFAQSAIADNYYTFIIDIYSTKSVQDMVHRLGLSILETLKPKGRKVWEKFIRKSLMDAQYRRCSDPYYYFGRDILFLGACRQTMPRSDR